MEKFSKRIDQANENCFLLHQVFGELEQIVENKLGEPGKDVNKMVELKFLWDQCGHTTYAVAVEACQTVVNLTLKGQLGIDESITALISNISTARHYGLLTDSIAQLMLRGSYQGGRHPFIALYEMQPESWPFILQQTNNIISCGVFEVQALKEMKPFVIYALSYGLCQIRLSLLSLILEKLHSGECPVLEDWILESLVWQNLQNPESNNFYLTVIQCLCEYAIAQKNESFARVMAIFLTATMQSCHMKYGYGIKHSVALIKKLNDNFVLYLEPIAIMVSQFLLDCHANCYEAVLDLCLCLSKKPCNTYVWAMLQCAVLSIFPYSSGIEAIVINVVESSPPSVAGSRFYREMENKKYFCNLTCTGSNIQTALATAELARNLQNDAKQLIYRLQKKTDSTALPKPIFLLKCAVFWRSDNISALDGAVEYVTSTKTYANALLTLLLKKLTVPINGQTKLAILYHLPALSTDKTCVPRVLQIFEALSSNGQLKPLRIKLLTELWKMEDRAYPYLEKSIHTDQLQTEEFLIAKASAIDVICGSRSEKYGAELLSVISDLLNSSLGKLDSLNSATIATLSLRSLVSLCRAEVVDLKSVWNILAPKLNQDHRPTVVSEMCNLLALVAEIRVDNEEYDELTHQAIKTLFRVAMTSAPEVGILAIKSLSRFQKKDFHLRCMPDVCKDDLKIPIKCLPSGKSEIPVKAEEVLDYVPGVCWMKLMDFFSGDVLRIGFRALLSRVIEKEIQTMPIWIYRKAATDVTRKNEPTNYSSVLKEDSVLAALIAYVQRIHEVNDESRARMLLAFQVLAGPFERPLPPLNWTVLLPVAQQYGLEREFMEIVYSQAPHSSSAQSIVENTFKAVSEEAESSNESVALVALSHLGPICKAIPVKLVQGFLFRLLSSQQSEIPHILNRLHDSLKPEDPAFPSEVKETIADILTNIFPILQDDLETIKSFASCFQKVAGPHRHLCDLSTSVAKKYITTLLFASRELQPKTAVEYVQKALHITFYLPCLDKEIVELIQQFVDGNCKSTPNFLLQFLSYIQLVAMRPLEKDQNFSCLLDTFALVVGALSDSLVFCRHTGDQDRFENIEEDLWDYFPLGLSRLLSQAHWVSARKNAQDWILAMVKNERVSPEKRRRLLDALPSVGSVEKETFFRVMTLI